MTIGDTRGHVAPISPASGTRPLVPTARDRVGLRFVYALLALPVGLAGVLLVAAGRADRAGGLLGEVARRFGGARTVPGRADPVWRVGTRGLATAALGVPSLVLAGYGLGNTLRNLTYPLWYADTDYHQAWGGPTLAGVWAVHAVGGLAFLAVCVCLIDGLTTVVARIGAAR